MQPSPTGRSECYRCHKPTALCVCADVPRVANRTRVHILQHKRERFHPIGTVRFARLGLEHAQVVVDDPRERELIRAQLTSGPGPVGVLYPSPHARLLTDLAPDERPGALIVLDGTWAHSRTLARSHPWLESLPHYALAPTIKSRYRIRSEPFEDAISTIEAITLALSQLEPELEGLDGLVGAFVRMIDKQIEAGAERTGRVRNRRARRMARAVPPVLREVPSRVVLVFGELSAPAGGAPHELVSWCAVRASDGATFERWCRPRHTVSDQHLWHMGLARERVDSGIDEAELAEAWRDFVRPDDVLVAWNHSTLEAARRVLGEPSAEAVFLKAVYANASKSREASGALGEIVEREGLAVRTLPFVGRAGVTLARLEAVLERVRQL